MEKAVQGSEPPSYFSCTYTFRRSFWGTRRRSNGGLLVYVSAVRVVPKRRERLEFWRWECIAPLWVESVHAVPGEVYFTDGDVNAISSPVNAYEHHIRRGLHMEISYWVRKTAPYESGRLVFDGHLCLSEGRRQSVQSLIGRHRWRYRWLGLLRIA